jgi:hypothetical protein
MAEALATEEVYIVTEDPFVMYNVPEDRIPEKHKRVRDQRWALIKGIVGATCGQSEDGIDRRVDAFNPCYLGPMVSEVCARLGAYPQRVYDAHRLFYQGGQIKDALRPQTDRCGGKGKPRIYADEDESDCEAADTANESDGSKLIKSPASRRRIGRPRKNLPVPKIVSSFALEGSGVRVLAPKLVELKVTRTVRRHFLRGLKLYSTPDKPKLRMIFRRILKEYYLDRDCIVNGKRVVTLKARRPTFRQFSYFRNANKDLVSEIIGREGETGFQQRYRPVLGDSTLMAFGPGTLFQADATVGDIYLVSSLDRLLIIGRPVIYVIIDVFSRLIVSCAVTLEGPSWQGMAYALENCTADKVQLCQRHGLVISEKEWPSQHWPIEILGDRGELLSKKADVLSKLRGIRLGNTASYRCDWKGIVERRFKILNDTVIHWLPGSVHRARRRGDADYRLDACLTLDEFRGILLECIIHHNNYHEMTWYRMDEYQIGDHVSPYATDLWHWGIQNRSGSLRAADPQTAALNLLPPSFATVTDRGIKFAGLYYDCTRAHRDQWYVKARKHGTWREPIVYDQRRTNTVFLTGFGAPEPCLLKETDLAKYGGRDWYDYEDYQARKKENEVAREEETLEKEVALDMNIDDRVAQAVALTDQARRAKGPQSKAARTSGIRMNREAERELESDQRAAELSRLAGIPTGGRSALQVPSDQTNSDDEAYVPADRDLDEVTQRRLAREQRAREEFNNGK